MEREKFKDKIECVNKELEVRKKWKNLTTHEHKESYIYNWCIVLYIIPRIETLIMLLLLTFSLTSYDPHPLGCLSPIEVRYNETQLTVTLIISQTVINYQQASVFMNVGIVIFWIFVKIGQYIMLPRVGWGFIIKKDSGSCVSGWSVTFKPPELGISCLRCCKYRSQRSGNYNCSNDKYTGGENNTNHKDFDDDNNEDGQKNSDDSRDDNDFTATIDLIAAGEDNETNN